MLLVFLCVACLSAQAKPRFNASEVAGRSSELMVCDLDGDGLKDLVLVEDLNLSLFFQDAKKGFTREPQQVYRLEPRLCVVWTAELGNQAGSLLVLNSDGVNELCFTNRIDPPVLRQIIRQPTIVPKTTGEAETNVMCLSLSVETGREWPLLLVPTVEGLQVWEHREEWHRAQVITNSIDTSQRPLLADPGYVSSAGLNLSIGDLNGDRRDDLIVRRSPIGRTNIYSLYLQQTNGLFDLSPAMTYADKVEPYSWLCWADINHDGQMDLIKSVWLNEASFIPGVPSGKVLVSVYFADTQGRIPAQPQQVFRKNDFMAALPVVDVDGDGLLDLVLGYNHLDNKESAAKAITSKQIDFSLRFYFCSPGVGFPNEFDDQRDVVIHPDQPEGIYERYVKLGGNFNGDGKTDLLVRDHSDVISVYFFDSREKGFSLRPDLRFSCPDTIDEWQVEDLNNDGISDLIVKLTKNNGYRIFVSQK